MTAPTGWTARSLAEEGHVHYEWKASSESTALLPGQSTCGFSIRLPAYHPKETQYLGGKGGPVFSQVTFEDLPFTAFGTQAKYFEGFVHADPLDR
jgi:hypothetical protein